MVTFLIEGFATKTPSTKTILFSKPKLCLLISISEIFLPTEWIE